ncbi:MAG: hypothetical protein JNK33_06350 [Candidatus Doudnabacteria bacterium]|nr:hypothetical protein [Candidatus Doudnabacteria bacterium]
MAQALMVTQSPKHIDLRWFVWTIVFLLVTGVSLVTYITYTSFTEEVSGSTPIHVQKPGQRIGVQQ